MSVGALSLMPPLSPRILMAATLVGAACGFSPAALGAPRSAARRVALPRPVMEMEVWFAAIERIWPLCSRRCCIARLCD